MQDIPPVGSREDVPLGYGLDRPKQQELPAIICKRQGQRSPASVAAGLQLEGGLSNGRPAPTTAAADPPIGLCITHGMLSPPVWGCIPLN